MSGFRADPRGSNESCLFLLCATPTSDGSASSAQQGQDFEFVPVAIERQYAERAQEFVRSSSSPMVKEAPKMLPTLQGPKTGRLARLAKQQKLLPLNTTRDDKPQAFQLPELSQVLSIMITATDDSGNFLISSLKDSRAIDQDSRIKRPGFTTSCVTGQGPPEQAVSESVSGELLLPLTYDPNEFSTFSRTAKDSLQSTGRITQQGSARNAKSVNKLGLSKKACREVTADNGVSNAIQRDVPVDSDKAHQLEYSRSRPELLSIYADIFALNPFKLGNSSHQNIHLPAPEAQIADPVGTADSSASETEHSGIPSPATSLVPSSASDQSDDGDLGSITKGFHNALSSIAKDKSRPLLPAFGVSAKAMSLLGQTEHLNDSKWIDKPDMDTGKQSSEFEQASKVMNSLRGVFSRSIFGHSSRKQASPNATTIPSTLEDGNLSRNDCALLGGQSKFETVLGIHAAGLPVDSPGLTSNSDECKSRPHSTLYAKLYSQVLKPSDLDCNGSDISGLSGNSSGARHMSHHHHQIQEEPVKRDSSLSTHVKPVLRMPFASSEDLVGDAVPTKKTNRVGNRKATGSIAAGSLMSALDSHHFEHHPGSRVSSISSNHSIKESLSTVDRESRRASKNSLGVIPAWQPQQLSLSAKSEDVATNLDHGLSCKRPGSPVKKMFLSTVEMIGRMIPASTNASSTQGHQETSPKEAPALKSSVHPADQNRLFGDLEYIIQDTANRFLLYQQAHHHLSSSSIEKTARNWYQMNRPKVAQFLYPIAIQHKLVEQNLKRIEFHGPLAGNATAISAIMHTWKYVARELGVRYFCLPDAGLQHFLREAARLLELLGAADGHMLHFQAWVNTVSQTVHANYEKPYSSYGTPAKA